MKTYIAMLNWTEQGIRNAKESPARFEKAKVIAKTLNCQIKTIHLTLGAFDILAVIEAKDEESYAKFMVQLAATGNLRSTSVQAFDEAAYNRILA